MDNRNIIRVEKNHNYTIINNTSIHDDRLSWKAKAIHVFMLSKPDDWTFYNEEIAKWAKDGIDSFNSGLKELKKYGYVRKERRKGKGGKFDWVTVVYEVPQIDDPVPDKPYPEKPSMEKPSMENPSMEKPSMENPRLLSTDLLSTNKLNTNKQNKEERVSSPSSLVDMNFLKIKQYYEHHVIYQPADYQQCTQLTDLLDNYQDTALIIEAMNIAIKRQVISLNYINGILKTWRSDGITNYRQLQGVQQHASSRQPNRTNFNRTPEEMDMLAKLRNYSS